MLISIYIIGFCVCWFLETCMQRGNSKNIFGADSPMYVIWKYKDIRFSFVITLLWPITFPGCLISQSILNNAGFTTKW